MEPPRQGVADARTDHDVADLADAGVGQHAFDVVLEVGDDRAEGHGDDAEDDQHRLICGTRG